MQFPTILPLQHFLYQHHSKATTGTSAATGKQKQMLPLVADAA